MTRNNRCVARRWADLSPRKRALIVVAGGIQIGLLVAAQVDLARRPAHRVRGSKTRWRLLTLVNFVGPLAYFLWGRKRA